jgi:flotillin
MLLAEASKPGANGIQHVEKIVTGIIEGETRVLVSSFSMEEIFTNRESFKDKISASQ